MKGIKTIRELIQATIDTVSTEDELPIDFLEATRDELESTLPVLLFSLKLEGEDNSHIAALQIGIIMTILFLREEFGEDFLKELRSDYDREDLSI